MTKIKVILNEEQKEALMADFANYTVKVSELDQMGNAVVRATTQNYHLASAFHHWAHRRYGIKIMAINGMGNYRKNFTAICRTIDQAVMLRLGGQLEIL